MKNILLRTISLSALLIGIWSTVMGPVAVDALDPCQGNARSAVCREIPNDPEQKVSNFVGDILSVLFYAIGIVAVIVIIVGGFRYATANGDSGKVKQAKDTILYAVIGLVVALFAAAIVSFVVGRIG